MGLNRRHYRYTAGRNVLGVRRLGLVSERGTVWIYEARKFSRGCELTGVAEIYWDVFGLGAVRDKAEGQLVLSMALVQVSDVTESRLLNSSRLTAALPYFKILLDLPITFEHLIHERDVEKEDD